MPRHPKASITATEAARNFGRIVDRVRETRAAYIVERGGVAVACIGPAPDRPCTAGDLLRFLQTLPAVEPGYRRAVQAESRRRNRRGVPKSPWAS